LSTQLETTQQAQEKQAKEIRRLTASKTLMDERSREADAAAEEEAAELFDAIDVNGNGSLSAVEFMRAVSHEEHARQVAGISSNDSAPATIMDKLRLGRDEDHLDAIGIFQQMDLDGDSQITQQEFTQQYKKRAAELRGDAGGASAGATERGHAFSVSNNAHRLQNMHGYTLDEFEHGNLTLDQRAEILFNALDTDGNRVISVSEFTHAIHSLAEHNEHVDKDGKVHKGKSSQLSEQQMLFESLHIFQEMDTNGDSVLSLAEFKELLVKEEEEAPMVVAALLEAFNAKYGGSAAEDDEAEVAEEDRNGGSSTGGLFAMMASVPAPSPAASSSSPAADGPVQLNSQEMRRHVMQEAEAAGSSAAQAARSQGGTAAQMAAAAGAAAGAVLLSTNGSAVDAGAAAAKAAGAAGGSATDVAKAAAAASTAGAMADQPEGPISFGNVHQQASPATPRKRMSAVQQKRASIEARSSLAGEGRPASLSSAARRRSVEMRRASMNKAVGSTSAAAGHRHSAADTHQRRLSMEIRRASLSRVLGQGVAQAALTMDVVVPKGAAPGQQLLVTTPSGEKVTVTVPEGQKPGETFTFSICRTASGGADVATVAGGVVTATVATDTEIATVTATATAPATPAAASAGSSAAPAPKVASPFDALDDPFAAMDEASVDWQDSKSVAAAVAAKPTPVASAIVAPASALAVEATKTTSVVGASPVSAAPAGTTPTLSVGTPDASVDISIDRRMSDPADADSRSSFSPKTATKVLQPEAAQAVVVEDEGPSLLMPGIPVYSQPDLLSGGWKSKSKGEAKATEKANAKAVTKRTTMAMASSLDIDIISSGNKMGALGEDEGDEQTEVMHAASAAAAPTSDRSSPPRASAEATRKSSIEDPSSRKESGSTRTGGFSKMKKLVSAPFRSKKGKESVVATMPDSALAAIASTSAEPAASPEDTPEQQRHNSKQGMFGKMFGGKKKAADGEEGRKPSKDSRKVSRFGRQASSKSTSAANNDAPDPFAALDGDGWKSHNAGVEKRQAHDSLRAVGEDGVVELDFGKQTTGTAKPTAEPASSLVDDAWMSQKKGLEKAEVSRETKSPSAIDMDIVAGSKPGAVAAATETGTASPDGPPPAQPELKRKNSAGARFRQTLIGSGSGRTSPGNGRTSPGNGRTTVGGGRKTVLGSRKTVLGSRGLSAATRQTMLGAGATRGNGKQFRGTLLLDKLLGAGRLSSASKKLIAGGLGHRSSSVSDGLTMGTFEEGEEGEEGEEQEDDDIQDDGAGELFAELAAGSADGLMMVALKAFLGHPEMAYSITDGTVTAMTIEELWRETAIETATLGLSASDVLLDRQGFGQFLFALQRRLDAYEGCAPDWSEGRISEGGGYQLGIHHRTSSVTSQFGFQNPHHMSPALRAQLEHEDPDIVQLFLDHCDVAEPTEMNDEETVPRITIRALFSIDQVSDGVEEGSLPESLVQQVFDMSTEEKGGGSGEGDMEGRESPSPDGEDQLPPSLDFVGFQHFLVTLEEALDAGDDEEEDFMAHFNLARSDSDVVHYDHAFGHTKQSDDWSFEGENHSREHLADRRSVLQNGGRSSLVLNIDLDGDVAEVDALVLSVGGMINEEIDTDGTVKSPVAAPVPAKSEEEIVREEKEEARKLMPPRLRTYDIKEMVQARRPKEWAARGGVRAAALAAEAGKIPGASAFARCRVIGVDKSSDEGKDEAESTGDWKYHLEYENGEEWEKAPALAIRAADWDGVDPLESQVNFDAEARIDEAERRKAEAEGRKWKPGKRQQSISNVLSEDPIWAMMLEEAAAGQDSYGQMQRDVKSTKQRAQDKDEDGKGMKGKGQDDDRNRARSNFDEMGHSELVDRVNGMFIRRASTRENQMFADDPIWSMMLREGNEGYEAMHDQVLRFKHVTTNKERNMSLHSTDWFFGFDEDSLEPGMKPGRGRGAPPMGGLGGIAEETGPKSSKPRARRSSTAMTCIADNCDNQHRYADGFCHLHRQMAAEVADAPRKPTVNPHDLLLGRHVEAPSKDDPRQPQIEGTWRKQGRQSKALPGRDAPKAPGGQRGKQRPSVLEQEGGYQHSEYHNPYREAAQGRSNRRWHAAAPTRMMHRPSQSSLKRNSKSFRQSTSTFVSDDMQRQDGTTANARDRHVTRQSYGTEGTFNSDVKLDPKMIVLRCGGYTMRLQESDQVNVFVAVEEFLARIGKAAHTNTVKQQIRAVLVQNEGDLAGWQQDLIGNGDRSRGNSQA
jgi:Ca2+-binding EF-hand superfamily protein